MYYLTDKIIGYEINGYQILVNCISGALDILPANTIPNLKKPLPLNVDNLSLDEEMIDVLQERGYLFTSKEQESEMIKKFRDSYIEDSQLEDYRFWICPTFSCNLNCIYCFEGDSRKNGKIMDNETVNSAFEAMRKINKYKIKSFLHLYGGEPLSKKTFNSVSTIFRKAVQDDYLLNIVTNGTNIPTFLPLLKDYKKYVNYMQITLDGTKEFHNKTRPFLNNNGTFDVIVDGIQQLLDNGIKVQVRVNTNRESIKNYEDYIEMLDKKGWLKHDNFVSTLTPANNRHFGKDDGNYMSELEFADELIKIRTNIPKANDILDIDSFHLLDAIMINLGYVTHRNSVPKFHFCNTNRGRLFIFGPDGKIYPCTSTAGDPDFIIGEFYPEFRIDEDKYSKWKYNSVETLVDCKDCIAKFLCGGECSYKRMKAQNGKKICDDPVGMIKEFLTKNAKLIFEKAGIET